MLDESEHTHISTTGTGRCFCLKLPLHSRTPTTMHSYDVSIPVERDIQSWLTCSALRIACEVCAETSERFGSLSSFGLHTNSLCWSLKPWWPLGWSSEMVLCTKTNALVTN